MGQKVPYRKICGRILVMQTKRRDIVPHWPIHIQLSFCGQHGHRCRRESFGTAGNLIQRLGIGANSGFLVSLADTFCHTDLMVLYNTNRDRGNIPFFQLFPDALPQSVYPFLILHFHASSCFMKNSSLASGFSAMPNSMLSTCPLRFVLNRIFMSANNAVGL